MSYKTRRIVTLVILFGLMGMVVLTLRPLLKITTYLLLVLAGGRKAARQTALGGGVLKTLHLIVR